MTVKIARTCDNPTCGRYIENPHKTYFHLTQYKYVSIDTDDNGPWDFCSAACLEAWAEFR